MQYTYIWRPLTSRLLVNYGDDAVDDDDDDDDGVESDDDDD